MKRLLNSTTAQYPGGAWIGLQNETTNRVWRWSLPGVEFNESESKWSTGQPDNKGDEELCVRMNQEKWDDESCSTANKFICYHAHNKSGQTFYISDDNTTMNWTEAQRFCRKNYTDLISGVQQLQDFNRQHPDYAKQCQPNEPCPFWIGLFRHSDWSWSDGSSFSFRSWDKVEDKDPKKKCAMINLNGNWSSDDCDKTKPFFCYDDSVILINQSMIWEDALYYCRDHYGDLVSITNLDEQRWVQERAKMASTHYVWLGLRYTCTLDFWFWVSDETVPTRTGPSPSLGTTATCLEPWPEMELGSN
ncbi:hypothetical protein PFLUV_G00105510 [Perca fluviatilis]|uniref:C-type lectin domain-containing protein n=1 Tax=Perca fluviatilis TaxID=8168 RepID=A0A6A5F8A9_PERFL|nr:hypothetical protein PFLUV_G00105510 [Perca fluviatilis]